MVELQLFSKPFEADRINLYHRKRKVSLKGTPVLVGIGLVLFFIGVAALSGIQYLSLRKQLREEQALMAAKDDLQLKIAALEAETKSGNSKAITSVQGFIRNQSRWSEFLKELSLVTPKGLWLTSMKGETKDGKILVVLNGESKSQNILSGFTTALDESYFFRDVKLRLSERIENVKEDAYRFQLEVRVAKADQGE